MTIADYSDLKTKAASWVKRSGVASYTSEVADFVTIAEARLNREIGAVETETTLTGTIDSRVIDLSSLSMVQPIALFAAETGLDEREIQLQSNGTMARAVTSGRPAEAAISGTNLEFDRPLDAAYPFRLVYRQRFALSDSATTNWLLTNHPDVYLAAVLMWGAGYNEAWANGQIWKSILDEGIPSVKSQIAASKRGILRVDPGLLSAGRPTYNELVSGDF